MTGLWSTLMVNRRHSLSNQTFCLVSAKGFEPVAPSSFAAPRGQQGASWGTTRGAAEGLLIVGCGCLGRYRTRGWAEATLKVLVRRWAHGSARTDAIRA